MTASHLGGARRPAAALAALVALLGLPLLLLTPATARAAGPSLSARAAILVEPSTGDVVFSRAQTRELPIASTTKLMTALLVLERRSLNDVFTAPAYGAAPAESIVGLQAGERLKVRDLLRALLLASANDAAATIARGVSGSVPAFVRQMNRRARQLGLRDTRYENPVGLDAPGAHSSARDLVRLALQLRRYAFFRRTVDLRRAVVRSNLRRRVVVNRNTLVQSVPWVNGVKTGHTRDAGYVLVGSASRRGVVLLSAVLGTSSESARNADTLALLRYGLARYRRVTPVAHGAALARPAIRFEDGERLSLRASRTFRLVTRRGERLAVAVDAPRQVEGPVAAGARLGTATVRFRGRVVARIPLRAGRAVPEPTVLQRIDEEIPLPLLGLLVALLVGGSLTLAGLARRAARRGARRRERGAEAEAA